MENYRAVIEVLKFSDPADVLRKSCFVHSKWTEVSSSRELWHFYSPEEPDVAGEHPKLAYHRRFTQSVFITGETKLHRFYIGSKTWSELPLSQKVDIDYMASVTRAELEYLFVCGAASRRANTFKVGVRSGEVCIQPALLPHRVAIGVLTYQGSVYAFCGQKGTAGCINCDKFDLERGLWIALPYALQKRSFFNPCLSRNRALLVGGTSSKAPCEAYDFSTNSFSPLPIEVGYSHVVSVLCGSTLHIVGEHKARAVKLSTSKGKAKKLDKDLEQYFYSGFDPIVKNGVLVVAHRGEGRVVELDLSSLQWESHSYPEERMAPRKPVRLRMSKRGPGLLNQVFVAPN